MLFTTLLIVYTIIIIKSLKTLKMNIGNLIATLGIDDKEFRNKILSAEQSLKALGTRMQDVGNSMTMSITAPLVALGVAAFKVSKDFEASMSKIVGLVGIAADEVDKMKDGVLSLSGKTAKAPKELADGLFVLTSAGLRGQIALDALEASAKAGSAGLGEVNDIARSVAGTINAYGSEIMSAAKATDIIVATARAGNFETSQLAASLGRVLPFAKQVGATFEDTGGAIALLTRTNGDAAQSVTQMAALFKAFVVPTEEAKKVFEEFGTSAADIRDIISTQGLPAALAHLDKMLGGNREKLGRLVGSSEAASAAFQILDADATTISETFGVVNNAIGMTDDAFAAAANTAEFQWQQALVAGKMALVSLGESVKNVFLPMLNKFTSAMKNLSEWFSGLSDTAKKWLTIIIAAVAAAGPFLVIMGTFIKIFATAKVAVIALRAAIIKLNTSLLTNPYVLITAAVVGLSVALYSLSKAGTEVEQVQKKINDISAQVAGTMEVERTSMNRLFEQLKETNEGSEERSRLIKRINTSYGDYLPNLLTEKTSLQDITKAQQQANDEFSRAILLKTQQIATEKVLSPIYQAQAYNLGELRKTLLGMGLDSVQVSLRLGQFTEELRQGADTTKAWQSAFADLAVAYQTTKVRNNMALLADSIALEKVAINELTASYEPLLATMDSLSTLDRPEESPIGGGGAEQLHNNYQKLQAKIEELTASLYDMQTAEVMGLDVDKDKIKSISDSLSHYTKLKKAIDDTFVDKDFTAEKDKMVQALNDMSMERQRASYTDIEIEKEKHAAILAGIEELMFAELTYTKETGADKQIIIDSYNQLSEMAEQEHQARVQTIRKAADEANKKALNDRVLAILQSHKTEEQIAKETLDKNTADLQAKYEQDGGDLRMHLAALNEEWARYYSFIEQKQKESSDLMSSEWQQVVNLMANSFADFAADLGAAMGGVDVNWQDTVSSMLKGIQSLVNSLLVAAIIGLMSKEVEEKGVWGLATAAVGIGALIAMYESYKAQSMADTSLQGLATGGSVMSSGAFLVGEEGPEIVNLKAGSAVTPNHMIGQGQPYILSTRIKGRDLEIIMEKATAQTKRG